MTELYRKGAPVDLDVNRLQETIGTPQVGDVIPHERIEHAIGIRRTEHRYKSVLNAWRNRLMREHNLLLIGRPGIGLLAADPADRVRWASGRAESGRRAIAKAAHIAASTDTSALDGVQRATVDHLVALAARVAPAIQRVAVAPHKAVTAQAA